VQLADKKIKLSPFDKSDLKLFVEMSMCPQIMDHISKPLTYDEAKTLFDIRSQPWDIKSDGWFSLCITEIESDEKLGSIGLKIINHEAKIVEVGFLLKQSAQGKGIASRALELLNKYAFFELKFNKIVAYCSVHNTGSYHLLEKLGFVREGCLKQNTLLNNNYVDDYVYGLCKSAISSS